MAATIDQVKAALSNASLQNVLSPAQIKALDWSVLDREEWVANALVNKARKCIDKIVKDHSEYQPERLTIAEKEQIVMDADIETAAQRKAAFENQEH